MAVLPAVLPYIIPVLYRCYRTQQLEAINITLKSNLTPFKRGWLKYLKIVPPMFFYGKILAVFLSACAIIAAITAWRTGGWSWFWTVLCMAIVCDAAYLSLRLLCRGDVKGLVGIILPDVKDVADIPSPGNNAIYLATHDKPSGEGVYSYEERQPILDRATLEVIRQEQIVEYYRTLKDLIDTKADCKELFEIDVPGHGKMHICDFMTDCAYTLDSIEAHAHNVCDKMIEDNSINFIGDKIGIEGFTIKDGVISLKIYKTDHFTFKVFKDIFKDREFKEIFQVIIRRLNRASFEDKSLICSCLKFLFSSFGLDMILYGRRANNKKGVLLAIRAGKIEEKGQNKIHVPVNESFSFTDLNENDQFSLKLCALRGIEEELGIPKNLMEQKARIRFKDFAVVSDEGEIGLGCDVDITDVMPLEAATMFPGQDKFLEIKELFVFDFPRFFWDPAKYPGYFYKKSGDSSLVTPWESFTPLLYQRLTIRGVELSQIAVDAISLGVLFVIMGCKYRYDFWDEGDKIDLYVSLGSLIWLMCRVVKDCVKRWRYHRIIPLVPQWNGDARCIQSINITLGDSNSNNAKERDPVTSYMMFGIDKNDDVASRISLSQLRLIDNPWCAVRHELVKNHAESPINFYPVRVYGDALEDKSLHIVSVPIELDGDRLRLTLRCVVKKGKIRYSFVKEIEAPSIVFDRELSEAEILSYSRLFGVKEAYLRGLAIGHFSEDFSKHYQFLDLFSYKDMYYWSVFEKNKGRNSRNEVNIIDKSKNIYSEYVDPLKDKEGNFKDGEYKFTIEGEANLMIDKLARFIMHPQNRARIEGVEIYMLQLAIARLGNNVNMLLLHSRF